jgi:hypothetical protein
VTAVVDVGAERERLTDRERDISSRARDHGAVEVS